MGRRRREGLFGKRGSLVCSFGCGMHRNFPEFISADHGACTHVKSGKKWMRNGKRRRKGFISWGE
jgi:hypothetical protein